MNKQGFTLVEVIVVSVIVAVLALSAIQLYKGYAIDAQQNVVENCAANAATFLIAALALEQSVPGDDIAASITSEETWITNMAGGYSSRYSPPTGLTVTIAEESVTATDGEFTSSPYRFR